MFTADNLVILFLAIGASVAVSILLNRYGPRPPSREDRLVQELAEVRATVAMNEKQSQEQQNQIVALQRALGEAQMRINYLQEEVNFYKRRADEVTVLVEKMGKGKS